jgi:hypothetical protein
LSCNLVVVIIIIVIVIVIVLVTGIFLFINIMSLLSSLSCDLVVIFVIFVLIFVIIVFVGNYLTPCMTANGASPSPKQITQVTTRYIKQLIANFPKSTIILTGFGRSIDQELIRAQTHSVTFTDVLNQSLFQLARRTDNRYVSVARSLYNSKGKAKRFLPCSKETDGNLCPRSRKVAVRSPDGLHLCPVAYTINESGVTAPCRVAIPGAARVAADIMRTLALVR